MLDKAKQQVAAEAVEKGLGLGIRFMCSVGNNRQIEMTAGVPLDWSPGELNETLDKLARAMDRQTERYQVKDMEQLLERAMRDLETNRTQRQRLEQQYRDEFSVSSRHGEWKPRGTQNTQLNNYDNTIQHLSTQIAKLQTDIKEAHARCL